jgi:hypothetical protein
MLATSLPQPSHPPCRNCGQQTTFPASRIQWHSWICSHCANQARDASPERYLARKFAEYLRRRGISAPYPGVAFVRQVLLQNNIALSSSLGWRIVVKDHTLLHQHGAHLLENAMVVPSRGKKNEE